VLNQDQRKELDMFGSLLPRHPSKIIDVGCGTGKVGRYLVSLGNELYGLDLSSGMLNEAKGVFNLDSLEFRPIQANMRSLPFQDGSFDGISSVASLIHVSPENRNFVFQEFSRILKPEGAIYLSVQNMLSPKHIKRIIQSSICNLGFDEKGQYYLKPKKINELLLTNIYARLKQGYAYLDQRHWYYPTKTELYQKLKINNLAPVWSCGSLSDRLSIIAINKKDT
jgi:ubiquinone/menaquinone biosynthesis C-methylase UbiE